MIEKIFKRFIRRKREKAFSAWQIELTTRCPLRCKMCIRTESKDWQYQDMPLEDFKKILPYLKDVENVVLEGWGESLLYPHLNECIQLVKKEGPQVGFVTSGKGLTETRVSELIDAGLDFVGFSIAGATPGTHETIRVNSYWKEILNAIQLFNELKLRRGFTRPNIHLVFLMLKDNVHEVPKIPSLAKEMRIEKVLLTNICHLINPWQEDQRIFIWEHGENVYENYVKQAEGNAKKLKLMLKRPSLSAMDVSLCEENPLRNLYISVDGEVSPCVYLNPPLSSPFKRIFCGKEYWVEKVSFGKIFNDPFSTIWNSENYEKFKNGFKEREKKFSKAYQSFLQGSSIEALRGIVLPPPPEPCRTCHKILGV
jgi:MoaA/NifB/PqqE/SkfB family radical SAM enzyme